MYALGEYLIIMDHADKFDNIFDNFARFFIDEQLWVLVVVKPGCESRYRTLVREVANFERDADGWGLNRVSGGITPELPPSTSLQY